jgi:hypothetical protein
MLIAPKPFGQLLNEWFGLLGRRWRPLLWTSLVGFGPLAVVVFVTFMVSGADDTFAELIAGETLDSLTLDELLDLFQPLIWVGVSWALLQIMVTAFVSVAATRIVAQDIVGGVPSTSDVLRFSWARLMPALGAALILAIGVGLMVGIVSAIAVIVFAVFETGFLAVFLVTAIALSLLVVSVWVGLSVSLYPQVIACERSGPIQTLIRSFDLVRTRWWTTAGFLIVVGLIVSVASQVLGVVLVPVFVYGLVEPILLGLAYGLSLVLYGPLTGALGAAYAVWYVDLRARRETLTGEALI